jgi:ubiquitin C-terminal hydrolase
LSHIHELTTFVSKNIDKNGFALLYHQSIIQINEGNGFLPELLRFALHEFNKNNNNELFLYHNIQQDASEALMAIMETFSVQSGCYNDFMRSLFGFYVQNIVKCGNCEELSDKMESYLTLEVPILGRDKDYQPLLLDFFKTEKISEGNEVECVGCGKKSPGGTKQLKLASDPEIVILVLKRYTYDLKKVPPSSSKIRRLIKFPTEGLILDPIGSNPAKYGYYYLCSYLCCIYLTTH